ncbi:hypothetical protein HPB49_013731 [Dermacentor silvarum]|uniref:Uncharacterized protein n=1 Tax=Dermacentor silvarum TaxID=543639 RepID=A0ACB8E0Z4_DERSI|nr:hypothetical protein HPB49_013731 [Dermacentor silvarum]
MQNENVQWCTDLAIVPDDFSERHLDSYFACVSVSGLSSHAAKRSHKLLCESYTNPASVRLAPSPDSSGDVLVKCVCFRSQRKSSKPYDVHLRLKSCGSVALSKCQCAAGTSGGCSHILAALKLLLLLKSRNYKEPSAEISCTELPQRWRRPRSSPLAPLPLSFVDWTSVRQDGLVEPINTRFYDARRNCDTFRDLTARIRTLGSEQSATCPSAFSRHLEKCHIVEGTSKLVPSPEGSPLQYLRPLVPHGYQAYVSPEILCVNTTVSAVPTRPELFKSSCKWQPSSMSHPAHQASVLEKLRISCEEAVALEQNTRNQAQSDTWRQARRLRVTASSFGVVVQRPTWTEKGLHNLVLERDLSRVRAVQYGIANEQAAVYRYISAMRTRGRDVEAFQSGLLVDSSCHWLGASPDRFIFDPAETQCLDASTDKVASDPIEQRSRLLARQQEGVPARLVVVASERIPPRLDPSAAPLHPLVVTERVA